MNKQRKTSNILNVFQYDETTGAVTLPSTLVLTAPASDDNSTKVGTTAWVRTYVSGLSYQGALTLTVTGTSGAATLVGNTLNIPTYTLVGLGGQAALSGTGFVKISGTTISYDNSTYATESYVGTAISNLVDSSPSTLDTLNELAAALGDDPNFATTVATSIGTKLSLTGGTLTGALNGTSATFSSTVTNNVYSTPGSIANPFFNDVFLLGTTNSYSKIQWGNEFNNTYGTYLRFIVNGTSNFNTPVTALTLLPSGAATFSSSVTTGGNINVNSDGIFINRSSSGEPYVFFQKNGVNRGSIYGVTGGGLRVFDESDNQVLTITGTRLGISDAFPSRKLTVNFGTSVNDGLIVYGSQRQNTVFQSTGEHCFIYIDSHHANTFLPVLHFQRSSTTLGDIGLQRASNSDALGSFAESEMVVGSLISVPFSLKTNNVRRVVIQSNGNVNMYNSLTVSNNFVSRNFNKYIKTWSPAGSTGSYTTVTYNWADELASVAGSFDSAGYYKGFIRSANGAHYNGYHFDILVGQIGYGDNSLQFKVQNITPANSPWVGGCGPTPFGTVDNTTFEHRNNPCGEALELFITKLGG
jgi:hypothetical protein